MLSWPEQSIGLQVYRLYGASLLAGITCYLPNIPGRQEIINELDHVIHDVLVQDIADTMDMTVRPLHSHQIQRNWLQTLECE